MKQFVRTFFFVVLPLLFAVAFGWIAGLVLLVVWTVATLRTFFAARRALAPQTWCPRGHAVDQFGLYRCGHCGAMTESWVWRCPLCRSESGWTACPHPGCGLAVRNPLV